VQELTKAISIGTQKQLNDMENLAKKKSIDITKEESYKIIKNQNEQATKINTFIVNNPIASILDMIGFPLIKGALPSLQNKFLKTVKKI